MRAYTPAERCMLLLFASLGEDRPLSERNYRSLRRMLEALGPSGAAADGDLTGAELARLGQPPEEAEAILRRLDRDEALEKHLDTLSRLGVTVVTRISPEYPDRLRRTLGEKAPMLLYCAGDLELLQTECVSLVGSRRLRAPGRRFAEAVGRAAAEQGLTLASGGAAGADTVGFEMAISSGGGALAFLADSLRERMERDRAALETGKALLVSLDGFDVPFSIPRAYRRNELIHAMGQKTFVAQSDYGSGGTWQGVVTNLRHGWSPVFVCGAEPEDPGTRGLLERGCVSVTESDLDDLRGLAPGQTGLFS